MYLTRRHNEFIVDKLHTFVILSRLKKVESAGVHIWKHFNGFFFKQHHYGNILKEKKTQNIPYPRKKVIYRIFFIFILIVRP